MSHSLLPGQEPGREGYIKSVAKDHAILSNIRTTIEDQATDGDIAISRITGRSIHDRGEFMGLAPTDRERVSTAILIHRVVGGKITEEWSESSGIASRMEHRLERGIYLAGSRVAKSAFRG